MVAAGVLGLAAVGVPAPTAAAAAPSSTTVLLSTQQSAYGQVVTASAAVTAADGPAQGDVVFAVDGVAFKANLGASGTASLVLPRAAAGAHAVQATFLPQDPLRQDGSASAPVSWQVAPVRTRLQVQVTGKRLRAPIAVHVRATGDYGTTPSGRVRIVVRRSGRTVRVARGTLEGGAVGGRLFLDPGPSRAGRYRVEVTYRGDADHLRGDPRGALPHRRAAPDLHDRRRPLYGLGNRPHPPGGVNYENPVDVRVDAAPTTSRVHVAGIRKGRPVTVRVRVEPAHASTSRRTGADPAAPPGCPEPLVPHAHRRRPLARGRPLRAAASGPLPARRALPGRRPPPPLGGHAAVPRTALSRP